MTVRTPDTTRDHNGGVSLRDHFNEALGAAEKLQETKWAGHDREHNAHDREHTLIATALSHQEIEAAEWRKAANEWRGTVGDLGARYVSKEALTGELKNIRADVRQNLVIAIAVTSVMCGLVALILRAIGI